jgi:hypothetical protein
MPPQPTLIRLLQHPRILFQLHRYQRLVFDFFHRKLGEGDLSAAAPASTESRH